MVKKELIAALNGGDFYSVHRHEVDGAVTFTNRPLVCLLVFEDSKSEAFPSGVELVPVTWDFATGGFGDPRGDPGFIGLAMTRLIEPHYQADEHDLRQALTASTHLTDEQLKGLQHDQLAKTFTRMICDKIVRDVLARKVAP